MILSLKLESLRFKVFRLEHLLPDKLTLSFISSLNFVSADSVGNILTKTYVTITILCRFKKES